MAFADNAVNDPERRPVTFVLRLAGRPLTRDRQGRQSGIDPIVTECAGDSGRPPDHPEPAAGDRDVGPHRHLSRPAEGAR